MSVVVAAVLAALVGCGSGSEPLTNPSPRLTTDPPATEAPAGTELLAAANRALVALADEDYPALAALVSPTENLLFSPYAWVEDGAVRLTRAQVAALGTSSQVFTWGTQDGSGRPLTMTFAAYRDQFVWPRDYTTAPGVAINEHVVTGNTIANTAEFFGPTASWVEYSFPATEVPQDGDVDWENLVGPPPGYDWSALRLVLRDTADGYQLIGVVHDAWTI